MKILIDMNLSPAWIPVLTEAGYEGAHWSSLGALNARDSEILAYAKVNGYIIFTHDLDFGAILAATNAESPSVLQVRTQDVTPAHLAPIVLPVLAQFRDQLEAGSLISIDEEKSRVRILPIRP